jgi:drug/metabolite transporter (DMT)-like permease
LVWSAASASAEWLVTDASISWSWQLSWALLYVAIGPAVIAYRCWGAGVQRVGPNVAAFFNNLTPLFAAVLSSAFLHETPHVFHAIAFVLIVFGIILSSQR